MIHLIATAIAPAVGKRLAKATAWGIVLLVAALVLFGAYRLVTGGDRAKARLGENQTEAAIESGKDAVSAFGAVAKSETERTTKAEGAKADVRNAKTGAAADAAARRGLCEQSPDLC